MAHGQPKRNRSVLGLVAGMLIATVAGPAFAGLQSQLQGLLAAKDLRQARCAILVVDLATGEALFRFNDNEPMIPASNMKLLTTAAALDVLGLDFVFRTELQLIEPPATGARPVTSADQAPTLVVKGDGDPAFGDPVILARHGDGGKDLDWLLDLWTDALRRQNVSHVAELIIDDRIFERQRVHPTWPADQLDRPYCAPVAGLNFFENTLSVYIQPTQPGQSPDVQLFPAGSHITLINRAITGRDDTFAISRALDSSELILRGHVKNRRREPLRVAVDDPPLYFGQVLADHLQRAGIRVDAVDAASESWQAPPGHVLHAVQTTMPLILERCNKDSRNLYAESLLKRMGRQFTGTAGSWSNGAAAVRFFLNRRLGSRAAVVRIADGSGLSRDNRVTARLMVDLLEQMYRDPQLGKPFMQSLAVAGQDGTLKKRSQLAGRTRSTIIAKSGYINGVVALSGYMLTPAPGIPARRDPASTPGGIAGSDTELPGVNDLDLSGDRRVIAFSMLFNDVKPPVYPYTIRELQDKLLVIIDHQLTSEPADTSQLGG